MLVHVLLPSLIGEMLFSTNNVCYPHQVVVNPCGEIVEWPNTVFAAHPRMRILFGVDDSEGRPVSHRGIRMTQICFNPNHSLAFPVRSIQHTIPTKHILFCRHFPAWTTLAFLGFFLKLFPYTCADVSVACFEKLFSIFVVYFKAVALNELAVPAAAKPIQVLSDGVIEL